VIENKYIDREKSWLSFNSRVLQEAADPTVPLLERLRFLGIFSNNLDEFFRVRFAAIRRLSLSGVSGEKILGGVSAKQLLKDITQIVIKLQTQSLVILEKIELELESKNIFIIDEFKTTDEQKSFLKEYFIQKLGPELAPIILNDLAEFPLLKDNVGYLAVRLEMEKSKEVSFALIEIPITINRFVVLPQEGDKQFVIMIDDVIRQNLHTLFSIFDYKSISAHMIKISRDAQLEIDSDLSKSMLEKISSSVKERRVGEPVRFIYDKTIEDDTLAYFLDKMKIVASDSIIPGGRYHNRRDFMDFPSLGRNDLLYKTKPPMPVPGLSLEGSLFQKIRKKDYLIHAPYQSFSYVTKFLREAAIDPKVTSIKITLYRLAKNSQIINSLINAAKNGKKVTVQIELQARFDEASNIMYSEQMQTEGINLIFGIKGLKVHSKICVIDRVEEKKIVRYGFISTGNFNESTARFYTDVTLFTSHQQILKEVNKIFDFFEINYSVHRYKHLIVSPHYTRSRMYRLIEREITHAKAGRGGLIKLKMNSLSDFDMIDKLYEASQAGVQIQLIVRGICSLMPGVAGLSENIKAVSIVDNYLEHSRIYIFGNAGQNDVYISSADFMRRNLDGRVEVTCPIYDADIKQELIDNFDMAWKGNVKARLHSIKLDNKYRVDNSGIVHRAQLEIYDYYQNKWEAYIKNKS
jgi:polyphosphate kinase